MRFVFYLLFNCVILTIVTGFTLDEHIRHCVLFEFDLKASAATARKYIRHAYPGTAPSKRTIERWFVKFRNGDRTLQEDQRSGRPTNILSTDIQQILDNNAKATTREIADILGTTHTTIEHHLMEMKKVSKLGVWVPHDLTVIAMQQRLTTCMSLLSRFNVEPFLNRIVTGDEKWIMYVNTVRKRQWVNEGTQPAPVPKPGLHPLKIMLSVWWSMEGIVYFELLPAGFTITADIYAEQLDRVQNALIAKQPGLVNRKKVLLLHDNARPHTAIIVQQKIQSLDWELLPHPPYSPDIAPSDYYLFRSLQNNLTNMNFNNEDHVRAHIQSFFDSKPRAFYSAGIAKLPSKWQSVVDNNGAYFID